MLKDYYHLHLKKELTDTYGLLTFSHLQTLESRLESIEKQPFPDQLEYVFRLIHSSFLHIFPYGCYFPVQEEDKTYYMLSFNIFSLPFKDETKVAEIEQWNDLVKLVSDDFAERRDSALRGNCAFDKLDSLIKDCLEDFDYPDRIHLDPEKLLNLVIFVYDYCILTMKEAHLHYDLDYFVKGEVTIRKKTYYPPHRV